MNLQLRVNEKQGQFIQALEMQLYKELAYEVNKDKILEWIKEQLQASLAAVSERMCTFCSY